MYAIIQDGGKQYSVAPGQTIDIEKRICAPGETIDFDQIVYFRNKEDIRIGTPTVKGVKVQAYVESDQKGPKLTVFKFRRRKDSRCKKGHRQQYLRVRISKIETK